MKIVICDKMTVQVAFLTQLDRIWARKRIQKGTQDEPKTDPRRVQNRVQNRSEKIIEKWTAQGSMTLIDPHTFEPQVPTGGVGGGSTRQPKDQYPRSSTPMGHRPGEFLVLRPKLPSSTAPSRRSVYFPPGAPGNEHIGTP